MSELLNKVEAGEQVTITRWGKPVAVLGVPLATLPSRTELRNQQPPLATSSADLIREMKV